MSESFDKFKNKILLEIIIKCVAIGIAFGLLTFSIPWLIIKVMKLEFNVLYLVLIGLGVALLVGGVVFLILMPTKKKIAKRIDNALLLNEKVQTMVEFENDEHYMAKLQRESTLDILSKISIKNLSMKFGVLFFMIIGIACAMTITAVAIPKYEEPSIVDDNEDDDPAYDLDNWTIRAILDIIEIVEDSTINEALKGKYVAELEALIAELETVTLESQMKEYVIDVIDNVKLELDKSNSNNEVFAVLSQTDTALILSLAIQINQLNAANVDNAIGGLVILISGSQEAITELDDSFGYLLRQSNLNRNDNLVKALLALTDALNDCRNEANINEAVKAIVAEKKDAIVDEISIQAANKEIADYIVTSLVNIFGLQNDIENDTGEDENSNSSGDSNGEDEDDKNQNTNNSGGLGTGDIIFGSNDQFYDPDEGTVEYGDVITKYYGIIIGQLEDGTIPEELRDYFAYYYDLLFGDFNEENEE